MAIIRAPPKQTKISWTNPDQPRVEDPENDSSIIIGKEVIRHSPLHLTRISGGSESSYSKRRHSSRVRATPKGQNQNRSRRAPQTSRRRMSKARPTQISVCARNSRRSHTHALRARSLIGIRSCALVHRRSSHSRFVQHRQPLQSHWHPPQASRQIIIDAVWNATGREQGTRVCAAETLFGSAYNRQSCRRARPPGTARSLFCPGRRARSCGLGVKLAALGGALRQRQSPGAYEQRSSGGKRKNLGCFGCLALELPPLS